MARKYIRAHPQSKLGQNYTKAEAEGWMLVGFVTKYNEHYPVFKETFWRYFKRKFLGYKCWQGSGD